MIIAVSSFAYAAETDIVYDAYGFGSAPQFDDIGHVLWAHEAIKYFSENGIIKQSFDNKLHPDEYITREEFVHILVAAFGIYDENAVCSFRDIDREYFGDISTAVSLGIVNGVSETEFGFGKFITRQDLAAMSCRMLNHLEIETSPADIDFTDAEEIAGYARDSVGALKGLGILNGDNNYRFNPQSCTTEAEAYKIIYLLMLKTS